MLYNDKNFKKKFSGLQKSKMYLFTRYCTHVFNSKACQDKNKKKPLDDARNRFFLWFELHTEHGRSRILHVFCSTQGLIFSQSIFMYKIFCFFFKKCFLFFLFFLKNIYCVLAFLFCVLLFFILIVVVFGCLSFVCSL